MKNFFLIISGPTGVGKTDFSMQLAAKLPLEIVNCDNGQFYTKLSVGTAKPDFSSCATPHHLFNIIDAPCNYTVLEYRMVLKKKLEEIWSRNKIPVLVGGSLFYIRSIFFPPLEYEKKVNQLENNQSAELSSRELWNKLNKIDHKRAQFIEKNDFYRITRALDIWDATGKAPSEQVPKYQSLGTFAMIFIERERKELYERINERVNHMFFKEGWIEEVASLSVEWHDFLLKKRLIGYPEIIECLKKTDNNVIEFCKENKDLLATIQKKTRNYAKRQFTFWRKLKKELENYGQCFDFNLTLSSVDLYINHLVKFLKKEQ